MSNICCLNSNGSPLVGLYQWDMNQTLTISGGDKSVVEFHFCNRLSKSAQKVVGEISGENVVVKVPNLLLQQAETLVVYAYHIEEDSARTLYMVQIPVYPRPKPDGYYYEDNIGYIHWEELADEAEDLLDKMQMYVEEAAIIIDEYKNSTIPGDKIAPGTVDTDQIADGAITGDKIEPGAVDTDQIADGTVTGDKIAPGAVFPEHLRYDYLRLKTLHFTGSSTHLILNQLTDELESPFETVYHIVSRGSGDTAVIGAGRCFGRFISVSETTSVFAVRNLNTDKLYHINFTPDSITSITEVTDDAIYTAINSKLAVFDLGEMMDYSHIRSKPLTKGCVYRFTLGAALKDSIGFGPFLGTYVEKDYNNDGVIDTDIYEQGLIECVDLSSGNRWEIDIYKETNKKISSETVVDNSVIYIPDDTFKTLDDIYLYPFEENKIHHFYIAQPIDKVSYGYYFGYYFIHRDGPFLELFNLTRPASYSIDIGNKTIWPLYAEPDTGDFMRKSSHILTINLEDGDNGDETLKQYVHNTCIGYVSGGTVSPFIFRNHKLDAANGPRVYDYNADTYINSDVIQYQEMWDGSAYKRLRAFSTVTLEYIWTDWEQVGLAFEDTVNKDYVDEKIIAVTDEMSEIKDGVIENEEQLSMIPKFESREEVFNQTIVTEVYQKAATLTDCPTVLQVGQDYYIKINGVLYKSTAIGVAGTYVLSNNLSSDDENFVTVQGNDRGLTIATFSAPGTYDLAISKVTYHKLDDKYLPNSHNEIVLTDDVTAKNYALYVSNGKLTLKEIDEGEV